ncbi:MAG: glycoside hydrolase family 140 protein [bacterium]|nr:glycoside hydrolase family 140 protein [bacterium]
MKLPRLRVHSSGRYLETEDGRGFFWLADTAWELFHRLSREEADAYLRDRSAKRFTVIQAVVLAELDGVKTPNAAGHYPLIDDDPTKPNEAYFRDVDWVVGRAEELGMYVGMLPTWGDKWHKGGGIGPRLFTPENARLYGRYLGERYRDAAIVWILGGDKFVGDEEERQIIEGMAAGLREGDGGRHLITFHPIGQYSSAMYFHEAPWLDFNMIQSGHTLYRDNYTSVAVDYNRVPVKPVIDGEPGYENIPHGFDVRNPRLGAIHVRRYCYWALFSGACGHTYGCNEIWQMWREGLTPMVGAMLPWYEAMRLPGSGQMQHARALIESGPYFDRVPDPSLVEPPNCTGPDYVAASRGPGGEYGLVYFPAGKAATLRTYLLKGPRVVATWYDPRTGERHAGGEVEVEPWKSTMFIPPSAEDWVLVLASV